MGSSQSTPDQLLWAALSGDLALLKKNVKVLGEVRDSAKGRNVLHSAAEGNQLECVKFIVETHRELMKEKDTMLGYTPLHNACSYGDCCLSVISYLVAQDSQLMRITDDEGRTPLHVACYWGGENAVSVVSHLVSHVQDSAQLMQITDKHGDTPLLCACRRAHLSLVSFFLSSSCDSSSLAATEELETLSRDKFNVWNKSRARSLA